MCTKRLMKELAKVGVFECGTAQALSTTRADMQKIKNDGLPPGIELVTAGDGSDMSEWFLDIRVLDQNPLYKDQVFRLKFKFPKAYPIGLSSLPCSVSPFDQV